MRAAAALPALFSSMKLIVELMTSKVMIPTKSCQSGGFPCKRKTYKEQSTNQQHVTIMAIKHSQKLSLLNSPLHWQVQLPL